MADVYRAHDPGISRDIAIKILKPEMCRDEETRSRFLREARTAGALSHPGIVTIHDVGTADGSPYIAMELLEGVTLAERIAQDGRLPLADAMAVAQDVAAALDYAHALGVIHRDIKPSNIVLCAKEGTAKLLDFGIAHDDEGKRMRAELAAVSTQIGQVLGTPRYMSPEQALGSPIDHRSDLFALGAVLYEMIVGKPAFDGASYATIAIQVARDRPREIRCVDADCPPSVQSIIDRLMAKDPDARFVSGAQVAQALQRERNRLAPRRFNLRAVPLDVRRAALVGMLTAALLVPLTAWAAASERTLLEQAAQTSGETVADFVAANSALLAADNSSLPEAQQDWLPIDAFVRTAARNPLIRYLVVQDAKGVVRASTATSRLPGARIKRPIMYAGRTFGTVEVGLDESRLNDLARQSLRILAGLALCLALTTTFAAYLVLRGLLSPIRAFSNALRAAGSKPCSFAHSRRDELGDLFDRYNDQLKGVRRSFITGGPQPDAEATRIAERATALPDPTRQRACGG